MDSGAKLYETVETIANTLPVCKERGVAYSTFTIIKVKRDGTCLLYTSRHLHERFIDRSPKWCGIKADGDGKDTQTATEIGVDLRFYLQVEWLLASSTQPVGKRKL